MTARQFKYHHAHAHTCPAKSIDELSFVVISKSGIPENGGEKKRVRETEGERERENGRTKRDRERERDKEIERGQLLEKDHQAGGFQLHVHSFTAIRFPDTFVTLFALLNPFRNIVALDSLFAVREVRYSNRVHVPNKRESCVNANISTKRRRIGRGVETYRDESSLSESLVLGTPRGQRLAVLERRATPFPRSSDRVARFADQIRCDEVACARKETERRRRRRRRRRRLEQMEKLDAVRDTNTLRVYSRLWLCFRN